jgi:hypothetical protein
MCPFCSGQQAAAEHSLHAMALIHWICHMIFSFTVNSPSFSLTVQDWTDTNQHYKAAAELDDINRYNQVR